MVYYLTAPNGKELEFSTKEAALAAMDKALKKYPDWKRSGFSLEIDDSESTGQTSPKEPPKPYTPPSELVAENRKSNARATYPTLTSLFPRVTDMVTGNKPPSFAEFMLGGTADAVTIPFRGLRAAANASMGAVPYLNLGGLEEGYKALSSYGSDGFGDMMTSPGSSLAFMTAPISAPAAIASRVAALPSAARIGASLGMGALRSGVESAGAAAVDNAVDDMNYDVVGQGLAGGLASGVLSVAGRGVGSLSKGNLFKKAIQGNKTVQQNIADASKQVGMSDRDYVARLVTEGYLTPSGSWSGASNKIRDDIVRRADDISTVLKGETAQLPKESLIRTAEKGAGELLSGGKILGDQFDEVLGIIPDVVENKVYRTVRQKGLLEALDGDVGRLKELQDIMLGKTSSVDDATASAAKAFVDSKYLPTPYDLWRARQTLGQKTDFKGLKRAAMSNAPFENGHLAQSVVYDAINRAMKDNLAAPPLMGALPGPDGVSGNFMSQKASNALSEYDAFVRSHLPLEELADHAASRYERNNVFGLNTMIPSASAFGGSLSSTGDILKSISNAAPIAAASIMLNKAPSPPVIGILADDFFRNSAKAPIVKKALKRGVVSATTGERPPVVSMLVNGGAQAVRLPSPTYKADSVADLR